MGSDGNGSGVCMSLVEIEQYKLEMEQTYSYSTVENVAEYIGEYFGNLTLPLFGFCGSVLAVIILFGKKTKEDFNGTNFVYLKIISIMEVIEKVMALVKFAYSLWVRPILETSVPLPIQPRGLLWACERAIALGIDNNILAMSIQRVSAIFAPTVFSQFSQKKAVVFTNIVAAVTGFPYVIYGLRRHVPVGEDGVCCKNKFRSWKSSLWFAVVTDVTDYYWTFLTIAVLVLSLVLICGLFRQKKRRDELFRRKDENEKSRLAKRTEAERNRRLTILMLGLTIPMVMYGLLRLPDKALGDLKYGNKAISSLCYEEAIDDLSWHKMAVIIDLVQDIVFRISRDVNFYLYVLLFPAFRRSFLKLIGRYQNSVVPATTSRIREKMDQGVE